MRILLVASEASPFVASGGLGDVMGALPIAIKKISKESRVEVILPYYSSVKAEYREKFEHVCNISFNLSWRATGASIYRYEKDGVNYLFVENHYYFDRQSLYGEADDGERFAFFSSAVIEYVLQTDSYPDVIHANDWQSALAVIYLKTVYSGHPKLSVIRTLYTIHNIEYQGKFGHEILSDVFGIDNSYRSILDYDHCINLMKGAITVSDAVSTVSPSYARELCDDYFAFGLARIVCDSHYKLSGVINGIDYGTFSPKNSDIPFQYDSSSFLLGKAKNKAALQREFNLKEDSEIPLIAMVTRLTATKGIDIVLQILDKLLSMNIQLIILGTGEPYYEDNLRTLTDKYSNLKALIKFDRQLSKNIYAASDMFLMPSRSEPCGLAQMIACSYGSIPIVRSVGGLSDSIIDYDNDNSNGFKFYDYSSDELLFAILRALSIYENKDKWNRLVTRAMNSDFSWNLSAERYIDIYSNLLN